MESVFLLSLSPVFFFPLFFLFFSFIFFSYPYWSFTILISYFFYISSLLALFIPPHRFFLFLAFLLDLFLYLFLWSEYKNSFFFSSYLLFTFLPSFLFFYNHLQLCCFSVEKKNRKTRVPLPLFFSDVVWQRRRVFAHHRLSTAVPFQSEMDDHSAPSDPGVLFSCFFLLLFLLLSLPTTLPHPPFNLPRSRDLHIRDRSRLHSFRPAAVDMRWCGHAPVIRFLFFLINRVPCVECESSNASAFDCDMALTL